jgi:hypothetical protein
MGKKMSILHRCWMPTTTTSAPDTPVSSWQPDIYELADLYARRQQLQLRVHYFKPPLRFTTDDPAIPHHNTNNDNTWAVMPCRSNGVIEWNDKEPLTKMKFEQPSIFFTKSGVAGYIKLTLNYDWVFTVTLCNTDKHERVTLYPTEQEGLWDPASKHMEHLYPLIAVIMMPETRKRLLGNPQTIHWVPNSCIQEKTDPPSSPTPTPTPTSTPTSKPGKISWV